eukprot:jgi/Mesen1/9890/ME000070S09171
MTYVVSQAAYIKLVLHALKHPFSGVNGVLIGTTSESIREVQRGKKQAGDLGDSVQIQDAVPLFHSHLGLAPMLELALSQVDEHLRAEGLGRCIVGYYHVNERFDDNELGPLARKVGEHIARLCPQACILLLDQKALESSAALPLQLHVKDGASKHGWRWANIGSSSSGDRSTSLSLNPKESGASRLLQDYIAEERYRQLVDFDDHLDDISRDWLNPGLIH